MSSNGPHPLIYVFTGPTLSAADARRELDAVYLPPVSQGDVYRAGRRAPWAIGIVDGYFDRVPAVWHKEILWALSQGIHVFGSASMGALRAAELASFGMEGVGHIFSCFHDGLLEDDDEVAVVHGPADDGYSVHSEAMVNIRASLESAVRAGVITRSTGEELIAIAKSTFYPERSYAGMLRQGAERRLPDSDLRALVQWLPTGRIDQKRLDAVAMLRVMRERLAQDPSPKRVSFFPERSPYAIQAAMEAGDFVEAEVGSTKRTVAFPEVAEELRHDPEAARRAFDGARLRRLALAEAQRRGAVATDHSTLAATQRFLRANELSEGEELASWLARHHVSEDQFRTFMRDEGVIMQWRAATGLESWQSLPDYLKVQGAYGPLAERAADKQRVLRAQGLEAPSLTDTGLSLRKLEEWYFGRLGVPVPGSLAAYARSVGIELDVFLSALYREYCYVRLTSTGELAPSTSG